MALIDDIHPTLVLVNPDGTPTDIFLRILQDRGEVQKNDADALAEIIAKKIIAGAGLNGGGTLGDPGDITLSADVQAILNSITTTHGAVLYRGTSAWAALAPGTDGQVLGTKGAGVDPEWIDQTGGGGGGGSDWELIDTWTHSTNVSSVEFLNLGDYSEICVLARGWTHSTNAQRIVQVSSDNGATWDQDANNYPISPEDGNEAVPGIGGWFPSTTNTSAARGFVLNIQNFNKPEIKWQINPSRAAYRFYTNPVALNAIRCVGVASNSLTGNLTGGSIWVFGKKPASGGSAAFSGARLEFTSGQSIPASTTTQLNFDTVVFDDGSYTNGIDFNKFVIPAGVNRVIVTAGFGFNAADGSRHIEFFIRVNSDNIAYSRYNVDNWGGGNITSGPIEVSEGDEIAAYVWTTRAGTTRADARSFLTLQDVSIGITPPPPDTAEIVALAESLTSGLVLDFTDFSSLFQDTAGTTPVTSAGDPVALAKDLTTNGFDFSQGTSANRPVAATADSVNCVDFDGTDDVLMGSHCFYDDGAMTVTMLVRGNNLSDRRLYAEGSTSSNTPIYQPLGNHSSSPYSAVVAFLRSDNNNTKFSQNSIPAAGAFDNTWHVVTFKDTGTQAFMRVDGGAWSSTSYTRSTTTLNRFALGALFRSSASNWFDGQVARCFFAGEALSDGDLAKVEAWAADAAS